MSFGKPLGLVRGSGEQRLQFSVFASGKRASQFALSTALALLLAACGGGGGGGGGNSSTPPPPAPVASLSPASLTFTSQTVNSTSAAQKVTLTNSGNAPLTLSSITISGDFSQTNTCSTTTPLAAAAACTVSVSFTPTVSGTRTGTLSFTDNASGSPQSVTLSGTGTAPAVTVQVTPASGSVLLGNQQAFTAAVTGNANTAVTWSVNGIAGGNSSVGTIDTGGNYTAPSILPSPATVTISAASQADSSATGSATVTVASDVAVSLTTTPSSGSGLAAGSTVTLTSSLTSAGHPDTGMQWTVNGVANGNSQVGTITAGNSGQATYTAPSPAYVTSVTVTGASVADPSKTVSATFPLEAASGSLTLSNAALNFSAIAVGTYAPAQNVLVTNSGNGPVQLQGIAVSGAAAADFAEADSCPAAPGVLAAGATCNINISFHPSATGPLSATLTIQNNLSATSQTVQLSGGGATQTASIAPVTATVAIGASIEFFQHLYGLSDTTANWYVNGILDGDGTVGTVYSGTYTAPYSVPSPNTVTVTVTSATNASITASAVVTIVPAAVKVMVAPASATVLAGKTEQFAASVSGAASAVNWDVNGVAGGNASLGTIDSTGLYTAPATPPSAPLTIHATSQADASATAAASVVVAAQAGISLAYLSQTAAAPFQLLTLHGSGFDPEAAVTVNFTDGGNYSVNVVPAKIGADFLVVSVPPYVDSSGALNPGTLSVTVNQTTASGAVTSNSLAGLSVASLPTLRTAPGNVTAAMLQDISGQINTLQSHIANGLGNGQLGTGEISGALPVELQASNALLAQVQSAQLSSGYAFTLVGAMGNSPAITVKSADLATADRMIAGQLAAWAAGSYTTGAIDPPNCGAEQAMSLNQQINAALGNGSTTLTAGQVDQLLADNSTCAQVESTVSNLHLIEAGGAVAVGLLGLAGPDEAALAAASGLFVFEAASTTALTAYGGYIAQGTAAGQQAIQGAVGQFDAMLHLPVEHLLGAWVGQTSADLGRLYDLYGLTVSSSEFLHGLEAAQPAPIPAPATTNTITVNNSGSGTGTVVSYPGGIVCGNSSFNCNSGFAPGSSLYLLQQANAGQVANGFSGSCNGSPGCQVTVNGDSTVTSDFEPAQPSSNSVTFSGTLTGSVVDEGSGGCNGGAGGTASMSGTVTLIVTPLTGGGYSYSGTVNLNQGSGICDDYSGTFQFAGNSESATVAGSTIGFSFGVGAATGTFSSATSFSANWSFNTNVGPDVASGTMTLTAP